MGTNGNDNKPLYPPSPTFETPAWDERLAVWISRVGSPPVLAGAGLALTARATAVPSAWAWAALSLLLSILVPALYVLWLVRQGRVTDFDLYVREQRLRPMLVISASTLLTWLTLYLAAAPPLLALLTGATLVQVVMMTGITLYWKISAHAATAAGLAVLAWVLIGQAAAPLVLGVPLVAWSRVRLGRHDLQQTVAGAILGSTVLAAAFYLV